MGFVHAEAVAAGEVGDLLDLYRVSAVASRKIRLGETAPLGRRSAEVVFRLWDGQTILAPTEHNCDAQRLSFVSRPQRPGTQRWPLLTADQLTVVSQSSAHAFLPISYSPDAHS
jgi:hypothetical protein